MKIAVLSGKGGTGKTTITNNLAALLPSATLIDCDVEEPNTPIFQKIEKDFNEKSFVSYPLIDEELCNHCKKCADFCHFNAILASSKLTIAMKEICHHCGGCALVCPTGAISYKERSIGKIEGGVGLYGNRVLYGLLTTGEFSGVKIIERVHQLVLDEDLVLIDCPPGTSCSTVASLEGVDRALVVTEDTPFGLSDMKMVVELLRSSSIPFQVIVNKGGLGNREVYEYCENEKIEVLTTIAFDREIAEAYGHGKLAIEVSQLHRAPYEEIVSKLFSREVKSGCS